jgi:hypothetical protein
MLSAMVPSGNKYWVFKLLGSPEKVSKNESEFLGIVNSLRFESGRPKWKLSEGWSEKLLGGITYAELTKEEDSLRATVTELPVIGEWRELVKRNINRWRGQLALDPQDDWEEIETELQEVASLSEGENKAYYVSLRGTGSGQMGGSQGPFQQSPAMRPQSSTPQSSTPPTSLATPPSAKPDLNYEQPDDWAPQDVSSSPMRLAAFDIGQGETAAELTVIPASGAIEGNLAIWFSQIGLKASEDDLAKVVDEAVEVRVQEVEAKIYDLPMGENEQSILVADIPWRDDESLFVKLKGEAGLLKEQREAFISFVESISW